MLKAQALGIPLPAPTELTEPHWQHLNGGELWVQRCKECGHYIFIPRFMCNRCQSLDLDWTKTSARGVIHSYSVVYRPPTAAFQTPYAVGVIELEEGWHMFAGLINMEIDDLRIGLSVKMCPVRMSDSITLPYFEPA